MTYPLITISANFSRDSIINRDCNFIARCIAMAILLASRVLSETVNLEVRMVTFSIQYFMVDTQNFRAKNPESESDFPYSKLKMHSIVTTIQYTTVDNRYLEPSIQNFKAKKRLIVATSRYYKVESLDSKSNFPYFEVSGQLDVLTGPCIGAHNHYSDPGSHCYKANNPYFKG